MNERNKFAGERISGKSRQFQKESPILDSYFVLAAQLSIGGVSVANNACSAFEWLIANSCRSQLIANSIVDERHLEARKTQLPAGMQCIHYVQLYSFSRTTMMIRGAAIIVSSCAVRRRNDCKLRVGVGGCVPDQ